MFASPSQSFEDNNDLFPSPKSSRSGLRAVSIKQLLRATRAHTEAPFAIEGKPVETVSVVARMVEKHGSVTRLHLRLEDGTGDIGCVYWRDDPTTRHDVDTFDDGIYVRALGKLTAYREEIQLTVSAVRRISDAHEIFFHCLEIVVATLYHEKGSPAGNLRANLPPAKPPNRAAEPNTTRSSQPQDESAVEEGPGHVYDLSQLTHSLPLDASLPSSRVTSRKAVDTMTVHNSPTPSSSRYRSAHSEATTAVHSQSTSVNIPRRAPGSPTQIQQDSGRYPTRDPLSHLSSTERAILVYVQNNQKLQPDGVPLSLIARALPKPSKDDLKVAIENLTSGQYIAGTPDGKKFRTVF